MTRGAFLDAIRQYGQLAHSRRKSFTSAVLAVVDHRLAAIDAQVSDPAERERLVQEMIGVLEREYAPSDHTWQAPELDLAGAQDRVAALRKR